jgi:hypothetical protein
MANTWTATGAAVTFASGKNMLDVFNATGSARIIRAYRFAIWNNQVGAITAALTAMQIRRITSATGGATVTPVKHDTNSGALDANTTCGAGRTVTGTDIFRRFLWLTEEATTTGVTQANWEIMVPNTQIYLPTAGDSNLEPITCRAVEGVAISNIGAGAVGTADLEITFTDAAS